MAGLRRGGRIPWSYRPGASFLHRAPAAMKLLGLLSLSAAVFFFGTPALAAVTALTAALSCAAGIRPRELLGGSRALVVMAGFAVVLRTLRFVPALSLDLRGATEALVFGWRMLLSFQAGALLFSVTTMTELQDSIGFIEARLFRGKRPRFALAVSLMLGFLPRFFEVWDAAALAWRARGGRRGARLLAALLPFTVGKMIETAAETACALEARGLEW